MSKSQLWKLRWVLGAIGILGAAAQAGATITFPPNQAPVSAQAGVNTSLLVCRFSHDVSKKKNDFRANINWGDATPDDLNVAVNKSGGQRNYRVTRSHTYAACGVYTVTCEIHYKVNTEVASDTNQVTVSLTSVAPVMTISGQCPATGDGMTASVPNEGAGTTYNWTILDAQGNDLTGTITSGAGTEAIAFPAAAPGKLMFVNILETVGACPSKPPAIHRVQVDFNDVSAAHPQHNDVCRLAGNQASLGCGGGNFCPDDPVTRNQLAYIGLKGKHAADNPPYDPPTGSGGYTDVPDTDDFVDWVEAASSAPESWMAACDVNRFCPTDPVTRAQLARFTLLAKAEVPLPATGLVYTDVGILDFAANYIEQLHNDFLALPTPQTLGCFGGQYCPNGAATRAHLAHFLSNAFPALQSVP